MAFNEIESWLKVLKKELSTMKEAEAEGIIDPLKIITKALNTELN
jgi:hypothetical protein